ncbi:MAG: hypothetical protein CL940_09690 [Deltaproteobacteria bacterium]|nr:hypothetical protein [Deltaproteobacteria bacterium]
MSNELSLEEAELHEREMALMEMEAELHERESGLEGMEQAFSKQNKALSNLVSYVTDQEASLRSRAEAMGAQAVELVEELLAGAETVDPSDLAGADIDEERRVMIERRNELLELRSQIVEDREAIFEARHAAIENLEASVGGLEASLLEQEKRVSDALRQLITSASSFMSEDGDGDDDQEGDTASAAGGTGVTRTERTSEVVPREAFTVIAGEAPARTEASLKAEHESKQRARQAARNKD